MLFSLMVEVNRFALRPVQTQETVAEMILSHGEIPNDMRGFEHPANGLQRTCFRNIDKRVNKGKNLKQRSCSS